MARKLGARHKPEVSQFDLRSVASPASPVSPQPSATMDRTPSSDDSSSASRADVGHDARANSWRGARHDLAIRSAQRGKRGCARISRSPRPRSLARRVSMDGAALRLRAPMGAATRAPDPSRRSQRDLRNSICAARQARLRLHRRNRRPRSIARRRRMDNSSASRADADQDARRQFVARRQHDLAIRSAQRGKRGCACVAATVGHDRSHAVVR